MFGAEKVGKRFLPTSGSPIETDNRFTADRRRVKGKETIIMEISLQQVVIASSLDCFKREFNKLKVRQQLSAVIVKWSCLVQKAVST